MTRNVDRECAEARRRCWEFLDANDIKRCGIEFTLNRGMPVSRYDKGLCGHYVDVTRTVHVFPDNCRAPWAYSNVRIWSMPGYSADRSIMGVTAHELGHHVHFALDKRRFARAWKDAVHSTKEREVTSYGATCLAEDIAETVKLFITNPTLLEAAWPVRYWFLTELCEMRPIETRHWREILASSERHLKAAARKAGER